VEEFEVDENVFILLRKGFSRHHGLQGSVVRVTMYLQYLSHEGKVEWENQTISVNKKSCSCMTLILKLMVGKKGKAIPVTGCEGP
jgi:hypothetical protein